MGTTFTFSDEEWLKPKSFTKKKSNNGLFNEPTAEEVISALIPDCKETAGVLADGHIMKRLKDSVLLYGTNDYWALFLSCMKSTGVIITSDSSGIIQTGTFDDKNLIFAYSTDEQVPTENQGERISFCSLIEIMNSSNQYNGIIVDKESDSLIISKELITGLDELEEYADEYDLQEPIITENVQSFIENNSFPSDLKKLYKRITGYVPVLNTEDILAENALIWTVPNWAKAGDIVFFMHTKTANSIISRLKTELNNSSGYTERQKRVLLDVLERGKSLHKRYGGKIYAIGQVAGSPEHLNFDDYEEEEHWKGKIYADIKNVCVLENPIDISEFNSFILVSRQGAITGVHGNEYEQLKQIIMSKNEVPEYFKVANATPLPLRKINKENWLDLANDYRRSFLLESQFRSFYVDYFLKVFADRPVLYRECRCRKPGMSDSFMDNIIIFNGKYLTVEVKLNVRNEEDLLSQVSKYCHNTEVYKDTGAENPINISKRYSDRVLIIDTLDLYLYKSESDVIEHIVNLDEIKTEADVLNLRDRVNAAISSTY